MQIRWHKEVYFFHVVGLSEQLNVTYVRCVAILYNHSTVATATAAAPAPAGHSAGAAERSMHIHITTLSSGQVDSTLPN